LYRKNHDYRDTANLRFDGGLHGKKSPNQRFLGILCAKRAKPLGENRVIELFEQCRDLEQIKRTLTQENPKPVRGLERFFSHDKSSKLRAGAYKVSICAKSLAQDRPPAAAPGQAGFPLPSQSGFWRLGVGSPRPNLKLTIR
jgi:hypothetical protein